MSSFVIPTLFVQISDCVIVVININLPCFITIVIIIYFMFFFFYKATTWYLPSQYAWSPFNMQHFSPTLTRTRKPKYARDLSLSRRFQVFFFLILTTMKSVLPWGSAQQLRSRTHWSFRPDQMSPFHHTQHFHPAAMRTCVRGAPFVLWIPSEHGCVFPFSLRRPIHTGAKGICAGLASQLQEQMISSIGRGINTFYVQNA